MTQASSPKLSLQQLKSRIYDDVAEVAANEKTELERKRFNQTAKTVAREKMFADEVKGALADLSGSLPQFAVYKPSKKTAVARAVNVLLSDLHIGGRLAADTLGRAYGEENERRRLSHITQQVISYKAQYREEQVLNVFFAGDLIENLMHDPRDGELLSRQMSLAMYYFSVMLKQFAANFREVNVYSVAGNHDRNTARHEKRAIHEKWDSLEAVVMAGVQNALESCENVSFHIERSAMVFPEVMGHTFAVTHGDTHIKGGNVGRTVKVDAIRSFVDRLTVARITENKSPIKVFLMGHLHTPVTMTTDNGVRLVVNGAMIPPNDFAHSIGVFGSYSSQTIFESTKKHAFGDSRLIEFDDVDNDATLDKIIPPIKRF